MAKAPTKIAPNRKLDIGDGVTVQAMWVDAEQAYEWLSDANMFNRKPKPEQVAQLSNLHLAGKFVLNGDTIRFGRFRESAVLPGRDPVTLERDPARPPVSVRAGDEVLLDGQNRLHMVFETGKPAYFLVVRGLDPATQVTMDQCTPRSVQDMVRCDLAFAQDGQMGGISKRHVAITRAIMVFALGIEDSKLIKQLVPAEIKKRWAGIEFVVRGCFKSGHDVAATAPVFAVMVQAYYRGVNQGRLVRFGEILRDGFCVSDDERVAVLLRNRLIEAKAKGARLRQDVVYRLASNALAKFLARERVAYLREASEQLFPIAPASGGAVTA